MRSLVPILSGLSLLGGLATPSAAQVTLPTRDECLAASGAVRLRDPGGFESAVRILSGCVEDGPLALGALWSSPPADSASRAALVRSTATLRDRRLFESVKSVAGGRAVSSELRFQAIDVLVRYFDPSLSVVRWRGKLTTMQIDHAPETVKGQQPLDSSGVRLEVIRALQETEGVIADSGIQREVRQLRHELETILEVRRTRTYRKPE